MDKSRVYIKDFKVNFANLILVFSFVLFSFSASVFASVPTASTMMLSKPGFFRGGEANGNYSLLAVSTQSITFIEHFKPEDILVADRKDGQSNFRRLSTEQIEEWMNEFSIGELWEKNAIGGRPSR